MLVFSSQKSYIITFITHEIFVFNFLIILNNLNSFNCVYSSNLCNCVPGFVKDVDMKSLDVSHFLTPL